MQLVHWIFCYCLVFVHVCSEKVLRLHEWHSTYDARFHGIDGHVPTLIKDGTPIAYTIGTRAKDKSSHQLNVHICVDNNPYWVLETLTDIKFVALSIQPYKGSQSLATISANDRCPQLNTGSIELLFRPLMYHVRDVHSATVLDTWITDTQFQPLQSSDQLKYCVALSRKSMVSIFYACS